LKWHVIAQVGSDDSYYPELDPSEPRFVAAIDKPGSPYGVVNNLLGDVVKAGLRPSIPALELLNCALVAYTADLRVWRRYNPDDPWTRYIEMHFPVLEVEKWEGAITPLQELLSFLTADVWTVRLRGRSSQEQPPLFNGEPLQAPSAVCLFSGGLDSFIGAIDLLSEGSRLALVGHYGNSRREQQAAYDVVRDGFPDGVMPYWFHVLPRKVSEHQREELTMRARSFLFLSLGTAIASAFGDQSLPLYVPENGPISLKVAPTHGRSGSHSTRTTHPNTVRLFREVLHHINIPTPIHTPYQFHTKGDMLRTCKRPDVLNNGVHLTMSCSRPQAGRFHGRPVSIAVIVYRALSVVRH
jgi:hypothetical protein